MTPFVKRFCKVLLVAFLCLRFKNHLVTFFPIFHPVCFIVVIYYFCYLLNKLLHLFLFFPLLSICPVISSISFLNMNSFDQHFFKFKDEYWIAWPLKVHLKVSHTISVIQLPSSECNYINDAQRWSSIGENGVNWALLSPYIISRPSLTTHLARSHHIRKQKPSETQAWILWARF